ncbi:uncharacterized protein PFL1_06297 [Pseudozyma flocculosa PF-1]|uniref:DUF952 domain-containing protein n=2 Tax=Pseudozyma flocculosa TaxID=84751 RepID=A0A5C3F783_9BASI|nr:uncharacterized protein PFL1_06297 [Pseudozyma flocculosa PF-1]EPQ26089.1 hypothetical protein PFL1_06297 [Pseudozyma flocculosa PF-1]SPO40334.1 uncharacterized protein PSFLO_05816 [Pseudozyma flocculosa]
MTNQQRDPTACTVLYKILTPAEVDAMPPTGWTGTSLDRKDGFIHLSSADQLPGTLERFFGPSSGVGDVLHIYALPRSQLDRQRDVPARLQFDPAIGTFFGHIYGPIDPSIDFASSQEIRRDGPNGTFTLGSLTF